MNTPTESPYPIRSMLVGVADPDDDVVLQAAVALARRVGAELHVVNALEIPGSGMGSPTATDPAEQAAHETYVREHTARLEAQLRRLSEGVEPRAHALAAPAGDALVSLSGQVEADLIVVGATRQGPSMRHILGSTADRVIRTSKVPVLVLRPPFGTHFEHLLLSTDRSELSAAALTRGADVAAQLAAADNPQVRCLEVNWEMEGARGATAPEPSGLEGGEQEISRFLASLGLPFAEVQPRVRVGDPAKEIVAEAAEWNADLIIIGTRGRAGITDALLGSVAGSVLRSALCNVLVVPAPIAG